MTFVDQKPGFRRTYTLHEETLVIEGKKWLGASFKQKFSLKKVKPSPDEHCLKDDTKSALVGMPGLLIFMGGVIGSTLRRSYAAANGPNAAQRRWSGRAF